jgi:hypothetical protein
MSDKKLVMAQLLGALAFEPSVRREPAKAKKPIKRPKNKMQRLSRRKNRS